MKHGICHLSIVPVRLEPADSSEQVTQLLFGDLFDIIENRKKWLRIKITFDGYEGWIDAKQALEISKAEMESLETITAALTYDTVQMVDLGGISTTQLIVQGSSLYNYKDGKFTWLGNPVSYSGEIAAKSSSKADLIDIAFSYLNAPYLWGGRTPFGIDCSGFSQIVYKLAGHAIPRDASQQALLGEPLSFIEEAEPGDLAFFDNTEGKIVHVGILLANNYIIHASGKVRIDRLDQHGIYNNEARTHTHRLRVIKKIF